MATVWPKLAKESQKTVLLCGFVLLLCGLPIDAQQRCEGFGSADG